MKLDKKQKYFFQNIFVGKVQKMEVGQLSVASTWPTYIFVSWSTGCYKDFTNFVGQVLFFKVNQQMLVKSCFW